MKHATLATIGLGMVVASATARAQAPAPEMKTTDQKAAYSIGVDIGRRMKQGGLEVDPNLVAQGLRDGFAGKIALTDAQMMEVMKAFEQQMMAKQPASGGPGGPGGAMAEKNLKAGQAFLAANKAKPGVVTLPSGVQYKVLTQGNGKTPKLTDNVLANYRGTLIDGTEFDSSYKRGEPAEFPVTGVIKGWTEILQLMKVGSKYQVFIPSDLAYGPQQRSAEIGPNSTLVFEIELLDIR